ncbi:hypothetical protein HRbin17_01670 [bacterium HR17]|uniref:Uncharacterized protein n=1 Tax=Candidatus Fervidibacter japonicus TaxID=2035412 RepID=A0A2H5XD85_9BACT|nr:hypothetical protein HRbin17_01670 [bacterium HR17]
MATFLVKQWDLESQVLPLKHEWALLSYQGLTLWESQKLGIMSLCIGRGLKKMM